MQLVLPELEAQWIRLGAPIAERLRPGLGSAELDVIQQALGFPLPHELRELWAWHDGSDVAMPHCTIGPGGYTFLTAAQTVEQYHLNQQVHPQGEYEDDPEMYWHEGWLPFMMQDAQRVYVDCLRGDPARDPSPVRLVSWEWEGYNIDLAPSLAAAVSFWTWLLASDYYIWNGQNWDDRYTDIPLFARWMLT